MQSDEAEVLSGIPQGSILGPVVLTIFINDITDGIQSCYRIFADDTKIYDKTSNSQILQNDINRLQDWTQTWNLYLNVLKCHVLHVGKKNPVCKYTMRLTEGVDDSVLKECVEEKDLGVVFDKALSFDTHIQAAINKANKMIGIIRRTFSYLDKDIGKFI